MSILQVGVIGCGGFARGNHIPNAAANTNLRIRAFCDLNSQVLEQLDKIYDPDYTTADYSELTCDPEIDMLIISTGPSVRVAPIRQAAEHRKPVYVEKPMGVGYEDTKEIVEIVRATGLKLQVGFNRPYAPIMREAKRIYKKMKMGETLISYRIVGESRLWPQFHRDALDGGESTIIHELTHIFDLLNWLTDSDPLSIYTVGGPSDNNIVTITYPNETVATIVSGGSGTEGYPKERMEVFSNNSVLVMNEFVELECTQIDGEQNQRFPVKSNPLGKLDLPVMELMSLLKEWRRQLTPEQISVGYYYDSRPTVYKGHYDALDALRLCVIDDKPTEANEYRGAVATIMGLKALESLRSAMPVQLDFSCFTETEAQTR